LRIFPDGSPPEAPYKISAQAAIVHIIRTFKAPGNPHDFIAYSYFIAACAATTSAIIAGRVAYFVPPQGAT